MRFLTLLMTLLVAGCAETVTINTYPADATVFIDDQYLGQSPIEFSAPAHHVKGSYRLRLEKEGYETVNTALRSRLAIGRIITDAVCTCGLVGAFKGWRSFYPANVYLKPVKTSGLDVQPGDASPFVAWRALHGGSDRSQRRIETGAAHQQASPTRRASAREAI